MTKENKTWFRSRWRLRTVSQWIGSLPKNDHYSQFGETLSAITLIEAVRSGRKFAETVYGGTATFRTKPFSSGERVQTLEDLSDTLRKLWSSQAGIHLRQQNPALTEHIGMYLEFGFDEPSVARAFAAWLDRIKAYVMREYSDGEL